MCNPTYELNIFSFHIFRSPVDTFFNGGEEVKIHVYLFLASKPVDACYAGMHKFKQRLKEISELNYLYIIH